MTQKNERTAALARGGFETSCPPGWLDPQTVSPPEAQRQARRLPGATTKAYRKLIGRLATDLRYQFRPMDEIFEGLPESVKLEVIDTAIAATTSSLQYCQARETDLHSELERLEDLRPVDLTPRHSPRRASSEWVRKAADAAEARAGRRRS